MTNQGKENFATGQQTNSLFYVNVTLVGLLHMQPKYPHMLLLACSLIQLGAEQSSSFHISEY